MNWKNVLVAMALGISACQDDSQEPMYHPDPYSGTFRKVTIRFGDLKNMDSLTLQVPTSWTEDSLFYMELGDSLFFVSDAPVIAVGREYHPNRIGVILRFIGGISRGNDTLASTTLSMDSVLVGKATFQRKEWTGEQDGVSLHGLLYQANIGGTDFRLVIQGEESGWSEAGSLASSIEADTKWSGKIPLLAVDSNWQYSMYQEDCTLTTVSGVSFAPGDTIRIGLRDMFPMGDSIRFEPDSTMEIQSLGDDGYRIQIVDRGTLSSGTFTRREWVLDWVRQSGSSGRIQISYPVRS